MAQLNYQTRVGAYQPVTNGSEYSDLQNNKQFYLAGTLRTYFSTDNTKYTDYLTNTTASYLNTTAPKFVMNKVLELPSGVSKIGTSEILHKGNISVAGLSIDMVDNLHVNDTATGTGTNAIWSANKVYTALQALKTEIVGGAGGAYDTLKEIQDILNNSTSGLSALLTKINTKLDKTAVAADSSKLGGVVAADYQKGYVWHCTCTKNTWSRVAYVATNYYYQNSFILTLFGNSGSCVETSTILHTLSGTATSVICLSGDAHSTNVKVRFIRPDGSARTYIELLYNDTGAATLSINLKLLPLSTLKVTAYFEYTAGSVPAGATSKEITCNNPIDTIKSNLLGNATTATTLQTARTINGVSFNGSANIAIPATSTPLTGYVKASAEAAISASDNVSVAIGKLEKALDNRVKKTGDTMTGDLTVPNVNATGKVAIKNGSTEVFNINRSSDGSIRFVYNL